MSRSIPAYPNRAGGKFIPLELADFDDGGAYPEIHVVQYPLHMGSLINSLYFPIIIIFFAGDPSHKRTSTISLAVDKSG